MRVILVQPEPVERQGNRLAYGEGSRPPETGLAVLSAWLEAYAAIKPTVTVLDPRNDLETIARQLAQAEIAGLSDWYTNHTICLAIASRAKGINPRTKIVMGGPNASALG